MHTKPCFFFYKSMVNLCSRNKVENYQNQHYLYLGRVTFAFHSHSVDYENKKLMNKLKTGKWRHWYYIDI